jgi:histidinol phosphatase-like PHP family hydrolase
MDMLVGNIIRKISEEKLKGGVILEHVPLGDATGDILDGNYNKKKTIRAQLDAIIEERNMWKDNGLETDILVGAEIDADPNAMDGSLLLEDLSGIEVILASTHFLPNARGTWWQRNTDWPEGELEKMYQEWFVWTMHVAANPNVDIIAHPGTSLAAIGAVEEFSGKVISDFEKLFTICAEYNTAVELNETMQSKLDKKQLDTYWEVIAVAKECGAKISIGSDSHSLRKVANFKWVHSVIEKALISEKDIFIPEARAR